MTKGEALKKMQAVKAYMTSGNPIWDVTEIGEAFGMAIEALEQPEQRWIPCSERLPEEDNWLGSSGKQFSADVLMTVFNTIDDETIIDFGHTTDGEWYSDTTECFIPHGWKVLAWMPLPLPYKGEQE